MQRTSISRAELFAITKSLTVLTTPEKQSFASIRELFALTQAVGAADSSTIWDESGLINSVILPKLSLYLPVGSPKYEVLGVISMDNDTVGLFQIRGTMTIFVVTSGSTSKLDWVRNLSWFPDKRGASKGFKPVAGLTKDLYRRLLDNTPVGIHPEAYFVGHSRGGACSYTRACEMKEWPYSHVKVRGVVTFGAPKPGTGKFADYAQKILTPECLHRNYVLDGDAVPSLPPRLFGFFDVAKHVSNPIRLVSRCVPPEYTPADIHVEGYAKLLPGSPGYYDRVPVTESPAEPSPVSNFETNG